MSRADFYIVEEPTVPYRFVCQLASKIRGEGYDIYIHVASREEAETLDNLLWTFRDISFLPHALVDTGEATEQYPVIIGWEGTTPLTRRLLINLSGGTVAGTDSYERIVEVTPADPEQRQQARLRYKDYRARGLEMHSHNISATHA